MTRDYKDIRKHLALLKKHPEVAQPLTADELALLVLELADQLQEITKRLERLERMV